MKFKAEIEIDQEILNVLIDYKNGHVIDSEYFITTGREAIEVELDEFFDSGLYSHYPLFPSQLGSFILYLYDNIIGEPTNEIVDNVSSYQDLAHQYPDLTGNKYQAIRGR